MICIVGWYYVVELLEWSLDDDDGSRNLFEIMIVSQIELTTKIGFYVKIIVSSKLMTW